MPSHPIQWVNTPVLVEAMERHRLGILPRSLELWLHQLLEQPCPPAASEPPAQQPHS
ncbi:MAG: hypothetical protein WCF98_10135 [Synechococcus sp. ELA057]